MKNKDTSTEGIKNKQFWLSVEKIRKFKERALQLDKMKMDCANKSNNSASSVKTVQCSASQKLIKDKALINKKRKIQPLELSPHVYFHNAELKQLNNGIMNLLKKEGKHKLSKLPPITDSKYNHLCNYNINNTISFDKYCCESPSPIKTLKPIDDSFYNRLLNNKISLDEVKNSSLLIQAYFPERRFLIKQSNINTSSVS